MKLLLACTFSATALSILAPVATQEPGATAQDTPAGPAAARPQASDDDALPAGIAARIDDQLITFDEYEAFLVQLYGAGPLQDLILTKLFEREAALHGVAVTDEELDREMEDFWQHYMRRFRGDPAAAERELAAAGFTQDTYVAKMRVERRRDLLEERIIRATRVISDEDLRARFEQVHGLGGVRVVVRHVLFTPARIKAELRARNIPAHEIDDARAKAEMKLKADRALARLLAGTSFEEVAKQESHDVSAHQNGGVIPGFNYDRYGDGFADAVRGAEVGTPFGPVESPVGMHLIEVVSRTTTELADVADALVAEMMAAPPSWQERNALRARLRAGSRIQTYR